MRQSMASSSRLGVDMERMRRIGLLPAPAARRAEIFGVTRIETGGQSTVAPARPITSVSMGSMYERSVVMGSLCPWTF